MLTLEAFPTWDASATGLGTREERHVYGGQATVPHTTITMWTSGNATQGVVQLQIGAARDGRPREWVVRLHLLPGTQSERVVRPALAFSSHFSVFFLLYYVYFKSWLTLVEVSCNARAMSM
jgi:hypothetical protein